MRLKFVCDLTGALGLCTLLLCAAGMPASTAVAQATDAKPAPAGYQELLDRAQREQREGRYPSALAVFTEAHALNPTVHTLRGLGATRFELKDHVAAIELLEQALEVVERPLNGRERAEVEELLARAYRAIGRLRITIEPASAQVELHADDEPLALPEDRPLMFTAGTHRLELRAPGFLPERRTFEADGSYEIWHVELTPGSAPAAPAPPERVSEAVPTAPTPAQVAVQAEPQRQLRAPELARTRERPTAAPLYKNPWLWTTIGVAAASGALAFGIMSARRARTETADPVRTSNTQGVLSALSAEGR